MVYVFVMYRLIIGKVIGFVFLFRGREEYFDLLSLRFFLLNRFWNLFRYF